MPVVYTSTAGHVAPAATIEIALTTAPMASTPVWEDITDYVDQHRYGVTIERGRSDAQATAQPGVCTFTLKNDDKRFTPGYTGGPYGDDFTIGKLVRVSLTHNSTTYRRFTGYITSMDMAWPGGVTQQNRVTVTAVDALGLMAQVKLRNVLDHLYTASGAIALWPLDDDDGTDGGQEITGYRQPALDKVDYKGGGFCRFDAGRGLPAVPEKWSRAVKVKADADDTGWTALRATIDMQAATNAVGFGGWVKWDEKDQDTQVYFASLKIDSTRSLTLAVDAFGRVTADLMSTGGIGFFGTDVNGRRITNGEWHHVYVTYEEAGNGILTLYLDGVEQATDTFGASYPTLQSTAVVTVGAALQPDGDKLSTAPIEARFAYWGVWTDTIALTVDVDALYDAGTARWESGDRTSTRVGRVLDWLGIPSNRQDVERGLSSVAIGNIRNLTALEYVDQLVTAEQGFFFQAGDGTCVFHSRDHRWDAASVTSSLDVHNVGETWTTDLDQIVNLVEVTHRSGSVVVADKNSRALYGPRELSVETSLGDAQQARGIGEYILKLRDTLRPRMSDYVVDLTTQASDSIRDSVLLLDLGSLFEVTSLPTQAHDTDAQFWVEGIREIISLHTWEVQFVSTPHKALSGFWVLGTTAIDDGLKLGY